MADDNGILQIENTDVVTQSVETASIEVQEFIGPIERTSIRMKKIAKNKQDEHREDVKKKVDELLPSAYKVVMNQIHLAVNKGQFETSIELNQYEDLKIENPFISNAMQLLGRAVVTKLKSDDGFSVPKDAISVGGGFRVDWR